MASRPPQNSGTTPSRKKKPPVGRRFVKGQSGNPGGRPRGIGALVKREVGENGERLIRRLMLYALGTDKQFIRQAGTKYAPRHEQRMDAIRELRNMGFGVPKQAIALSDPDGAPLVFTLKLDRRSDGASDA